jgi:mannitol/fructose-specific phosphotransferase system IIA component (Ntr-type)
MGDPDSCFDFFYIFNMALKENNDQLSMLKTIIHLVKDKDYLKDCKNKSLEDIREELLELLCKGNGATNPKEDLSN